MLNVPTRPLGVNVRGTGELISDILAATRGTACAPSPQALESHTPAVAERMATVFPWMLALSPADRETCAQELVDAARASLSTDQPHPVIAELTSWKETATAVAAGLGSTDLEWLDDADADVNES